MKQTISLILVLVFSISFVAYGQGRPRKDVPLRDGFVIDSIDGKLSLKGDSWFFNTFDTLTDGKGILVPGTAVEILPSSMLEKLSSTIQGENKKFRIWGKFTKYEDKNFIYLSYFLPVAEVNEPAEANSVSDANEEQIIPDDVLALLKPRRKINLAELKKPLSADADGIIADRTGFLRKTKEGFYFDFDAMGRNIDTLSLPLLWCDVLEIMTRQQDEFAMPMRFRISSIVTGYKGKNYLLLQRATRAYNHGNFAR